MRTQIVNLGKEEDRRTLTPKTKKKEIDEKSNENIQPRS